MSRYWKCTMTNDNNNSFKMGKVYETNDDGTDFEDEEGWYYNKTHIEDLSSAEFQEMVEGVKRRYNLDKYWKCTKSESDWFKKGKIYVSDAKGGNVVNEHGYKLKAKIPIDLIPIYNFEEVTHEEWMEQEYKAYYEEEEKMKNKRYWKCIQSDRSDFTEGKVYKTDSNKLNFADDDNYTWMWREIDDFTDALFREITEEEYFNMNEENTCNGVIEADYEMVNHPSHYNSNSKGIEVIDVMDAFTEGLVGIDAIDIGTAIKYIGRLGKKDNPVQEVKKAIWYLQHYVDRKENESGNN